MFTKLNFFLTFSLLTSYVESSSYTCGENVAKGKILEGLFVEFPSLSRATDCQYNVSTTLTLNYGNQAAMNLGQKYFLDKIYFYASGEITGTLFLMVKNEFNQLNQLDPTTDRLCPITSVTPVNTTFTNSLGTNEALNLTKYEALCNLDASTGPYQYVGYWVNQTSISINEFEVSKVIDETTTSLMTTYETTTVPETTLTKTITSAETAFKTTTPPAIRSSESNDSTKKTDQATPCPDVKETMSAAVASHCCLLGICMASFIAIFI